MSIETLTKRNAIVEDIGIRLEHQGREDLFPQIKKALDRLPVGPFAIAIDNGRCSCTWEYLEDESGKVMEFPDEHEATLYAIDHDIKGFNVVEL